MGVRSAPRCGTPSGFTAHQNRDEKPCPACWAAKSAYDKRLRAAPKRAQTNRMHARAQSKAHSELAAAHKAEYDALYAKWKAHFAAEMAAAVPEAGRVAQ